MNHTSLLANWLRDGSPPSDAGDIVELLRSARHERVHALLIDDAIRHAENAGVPTEFVDALRADRRQLAMKEAIVSRGLASTLKALEHHRISPVILKGRALGLTCYNEPWHRPHSDVDLLIAPEHVEQIHELLPQRGYSMPHGVRGLATSHQFLYAKPLQLGVTLNLDVHWKLSNRHYFAHAISAKDALRQSDALQREGTTHRVVGPTHALLHAAIHLKAHHHDTHQPLIWFYDIHLLLNSMSRAQLAETTEHARRVGAVSALRDAVEATLRLFSTPVADEFTQTLRSLADDRSQSFDGISRIGEIRSDLQAIRSRRLRARYISELLVPPPQQLLSRYSYTSRAMLPLALMRRSAEVAIRTLRGESDSESDG